MEGNLREAESEYLRAYDEWKTLGKAPDADAAAVLNYLGRCIHPRRGIRKPLRC
jgi:hypothetical protein